MPQKPLTMGVIGSSSKENEKRAPIHPEHILQISEDFRKRIFFETGYGDRFGFKDKDICSVAAGTLNRVELFETCDIILLPKPTKDDFEYFKEGQIIWGWPHCVQGELITQAGIDKKLTYIAWEEMHIWGRKGQWLVHVFHVNNELAGYCSVMHSLQLQGLTGHYGPFKKAVVIGFGSVGRGAIHALRSLGYTDITLLTMRSCESVSSPIPGVKHWQYRRIDGGDTEVILTEEAIPMPKALGHFDIILNATLQDTESPQMFLKASELSSLNPGTLIIDVSCDEGMGFDFAKPTSFESPDFLAPGGNNITYYAVDHSPSFLWNTATHAISRALLPHIETVMRGPETWDSCETIRRSIEIRHGVVQNPRILKFQNREEKWPHRKIT